MPYTLWQTSPNPTWWLPLGVWSTCRDFCDCRNRVRITWHGKGVAKYCFVRPAENHEHTNPVLRTFYKTRNFGNGSESTDEINYELMEYYVNKFTEVIDQGECEYL